MTRTAGPRHCFRHSFLLGGVKTPVKDWLLLHVAPCDSYSILGPCSSGLIQCPKRVSQNQAYNPLILQAESCATMLTEKAYFSGRSCCDTKLHVSPTNPSLSVYMAKFLGCARLRPR